MSPKKYVKKYIALVKKKRSGTTWKKHNELFHGLYFSNKEKDKICKKLHKFHQKRGSIFS